MLDERRDIPVGSRQAYVGVGSKCLEMKMYIDRIRDEAYTESTDPSLHEVLEQSKRACAKVAEACKCIGADNKNCWESYGMR
jgi:formiminotetrahydrofolate cyclodeaminase